MALSGTFLGSHRTVASLFCRLEEWTESGPLSVGPDLLVTGRSRLDHLVRSRRTTCVYGKYTSTSTSRGFPKGHSRGLTGFRRWGVEWVGIVYMDRLLHGTV